MAEKTKQGTAELPEQQAAAAGAEGQGVVRGAVGAPQREGVLGGLAHRTGQSGDRSMAPKHAD